MSKFLNSFADFVKSNNINIYTIAEITGSNEPELVKLVPCNPCQNSYSVSKFFTLTAVGLLWDEGRIELCHKLTDILADHCPTDMHPKWREATVEMAIRHRCGLPQGYLDIDCDDVSTFGKDYLAYVLSTPVGDTENYSYTDAEFYLLARAVTERAEKPICEYLWDKLFYKLGFKELAWSCCPMNHAMGATGLYIRTEDMVKLGGLYLNKGIYKGERLLSERWINTVIENGYLPGYSAGGYGHGGMLGQMLLVLPNHNRAVAWHGYHTDSEKVNKWITEYVEKETKGLV